MKKYFILKSFLISKNLLGRFFTQYKVWSFSKTSLLVFLGGKSMLHGWESFTHYNFIFLLLYVIISFLILIETIISPLQWKWLHKLRGVFEELKIANLAILLTCCIYYLNNGYFDDLKHSLQDASLELFLELVLPVLG